MSETTTERKLKVAIGMPIYASMCNANSMISLFNTMGILKQYGVESYPIFIMGESLITRARNNIVAKFLNDPDSTHLIFIDSDIVWNPVEVLKLLKHDKDIVGGVYPLKTYKWEKLENLDEILDRHQNDLNKDVPKVEFIKQNLLKYNLNYKYAQFRVENNLVEVKHIATGFMMIKREVLEKMILQHPELKFWDDMGCLNKEEDRFAYTLFDCEVVDGHYYSEDWLFCHRWTQMGGQVFADVTINLTHVGYCAYQGRYLSSLNIGNAKTTMTPVSEEKTLEDIKNLKVVETAEDADKFIQEKLAERETENTEEVPKIQVKEVEEMD